MTFGPEGDETGDKGVWMSIWIENVDVVYQHCVAQELEVAWPPTNMPWGVRGMHVRHPDRHVFRLTQAIEEGHEEQGASDPCHTPLSLDNIPPPRTAHRLQQ